MRAWREALALFSDIGTPEAEQLRALCGDALQA
jgi:hypothetical protein